MAQATRNGIARRVTAWMDALRELGMVANADNSIRSSDLSRNMTTANRHKSVLQ
jgi:hypothetical protein